MTHAAADHTAVVDSRYTLLINGGPPAGQPFSGQHQRMLAAFGAFLVAILERRQLVASRQDNQRLSEGNKMRTSILRAVSPRPAHTAGRDQAGRQQPSPGGGAVFPGG